MTTQWLKTVKFSYCVRSLRFWREN